MGLAPEFFVLLGIDLFLGLSIVSALLDDNVPGFMQYAFQAAGLVGLAELFLESGFIGAMFGPDPYGPVRFWMSIIYVSGAVVSTAGLSFYLALLKKQIALAATFTVSVALPGVIASLFFLYGFISSSGSTSFNPMTVITITVAALVSGLSILGFLRQVLKHTTRRTGDKATSIPEMMQPEGQSGVKMTDASGTADDANSPSGTTVHSIGNFSFELPYIQKDESEEASRGSSENG